MPTYSHLNKVNLFYQDRKKAYTFIIFPVRIPVRYHNSDTSLRMKLTPKADLHKRIYESSICKYAIAICEKKITDKTNYEIHSKNISRV